jgi:hypothetical protein
MRAGDLLMQHFERIGQMTDEKRKVAKKYRDSFQNGYQKWYTEALAVVRQLLPDRLAEFQQLYNGDGRRKKVEAMTYHIQDWLNGIRAPKTSAGEELFDALAIVLNRFQTQLPAIGRTTLREQPL